MIEINKTLISDHLLEKRFVCDLSACKGECCIAGDAGAPLEEDELKTLRQILPEVLPYLSDEGRKTIEKKGVYEIDEDGDFVTPLMETGQKPCAFVVFDKHNIAKCGIEQAYLDGKITFKKPISCHLYPVRLAKSNDYTLVNYDQWSICKPACTLGEQLNVKVYKFLKEPLIRKFGEDWYNELSTIDNYLETKS